MIIGAKGNEIGCCGREGGSSDGGRRTVVSRTVGIGGSSSTAVISCATSLVSDTKVMVSTVPVGVRCCELFTFSEWVGMASESFFGEEASSES